ncbi:MAG: SH3 domain-containing protein [Oscillospiraceae bacterium]|jgi:cell wall-associated NlpC family hydrolase|nr:SH3 domain-containing protein [Oscillospiraceae bacterium]
MSDSIYNKSYTSIRKSVYGAVITAALAMALFFGLSAASTPASAESRVVYGAATVSGNNLNVRKSASLSAEVITRLDKGTIVVIIEKKGDWYLINYNGTIGYCSVDYFVNVITKENFKATAQVTHSNVNLREKPNTSSKVLGTYSKISVNVIGVNEGWYKVEYDGKTGYVRTDYITITGSGSGGGSTSSGNSSSGSGSGGTSTTAVSDSTTTTASAERVALGKEIANYALQFVGYKYVYGAESPSAGFDCSGLMYYVYRQFGFKLNRTANNQWAQGNTRVVGWDEVIPGDLVFISAYGNQTITHVGMYVGNKLMVHASNPTAGVVVSTLDQGYYTNRIVGFKRVDF